MSYTTDDDPALLMRRSVLEVLEVADTLNDSDTVTVTLRPGEWPSIIAKIGDGRKVVMPGSVPVARVTITPKLSP